MADRPELKVVTLDREPISEQVVAQLLGMVKVGNLKAGDQLPPERELAQSFDVSRPTIREAVRALVVLGVLTTRRGGGIYVSNLRAETLLAPLQFFMSLEDTTIEVLYDARELIEGGIAYRAASAVTDEDLAFLHESIEQQRLVVADPRAYRKLDVAFHRRIHALGGNPFLSRAAASLNVLGLELRTVASESADVIEQSLLDHAEIVAMLSKRDAQGAEHAMRNHMRSVLESTQKTIRERDRGGS